VLVDFGTPGSVRKNWQVRHPSPLKVSFYGTVDRHKTV
jgi:hypothetical protein